MDLTTAEGFAAAVLGHDNDELTVFAESVIGLQLRELCDDMLEFVKKVRALGDAASRQDMQRRADEDTEQINRMAFEVGGAFVLAHPGMTPNVAEVMKRKARVAALELIERIVMETQMRAIRGDVQTNMVVLQ